MTGNVFVIADLHLGHRRVAELRGFEDQHVHDAFIVSAWNRVVGKRDVVYVLGDVFRLDRVAELNGTKKLALGNHDRRPVAEYAALFSKVAAYYEFDGCLLSHVPVHPCQAGRYETPGAMVWLNVHGHMHAHGVNDLRYLCVSVEQCPRMQPVLLREAIRARRVALKGAR